MWGIATRYLAQSIDVYIIRNMSNEPSNLSNPQAVTALKTHLDTLIESASYWPESPSKDVQAVLDEAIKNFQSSGVQLLTDATRYVWWFYQDIVKNHSQEILEDYNIPTDIVQDDIWKYVVVRFGPTVGIGGDQKYTPGRAYIVFDADFIWEEEHGLQLVIEHGLKICRVSHYDGRYTNANAYGDESLLGEVYLRR